ncbi:phosphotidylinositol phosphatase PTPRQ-like [Clonorchis sinensis]|uniref:Phosphotidylinositol phosphatase PTPRQ-like n=1 Tax=Clonorchis sinensis TaxID=79923 RepID=G7YSA7_CLOSI|nr:phosphotidylinositol phosphatase PTPRQ-like [Clonorchis sinensis]
MTNGQKIMRVELAKGLQPNTVSSAYCSAPEKPYNISVKIKPFVDDRVLANISWAYNSTCAISTFNVTGKNPAGKMITESIKKKHVALYWQDRCYPLPFAVRAVSSIGVDGDTSEKYIVFHEAPNTPMDVHLLRLGQTTWSVSWNDSSQCQNYSGYHYTVAVYDKENQWVKEQNTTERSTTLENLDWCLEYWVRVRAIGSAGRSNESTALKLQESSAPNMLTDIQLSRLAHTKWMVSWNDSSECQNYSGYHYTVAVYDTENQLVNEQNTTDQSMILEDLDWCLEYWVRVRAIGPAGWSNESTALKLQDTVAPKTPTNLRIYKAKESQNWLLFWDDSSECQAHPDYHYILSIYNLYYQRVLQKNVNGKYVTLEDFYVCAGFWIRLRSIASWGQSKDSLAVRLSDFAAPRPPTNFRMDGNAGSHAWFLSWDDRSECQTYPGYHYLVSIFDRHDQRALQKRVRTKYVMLDDFYVCADFRVRIRSVGSGEQSIESPAVRLSEFSGKQPEPPYNVMIQLQVLKRMVTVYWTQNCARSFTVAFYVGTLVTRMESTYRNTMTFGNLPRNQSLHVGITAISEYGMSDEAPSSLFYITPS